MSHYNNIVRLKAVQNLLQNTGVNFAFVGGATVSLYAQRETDDVRPTDDVDVVVEIATYGAAFTKLTERLLELGFNPDKESGVICRYLYNGLVIDVMPVSDAVFGFNNRWYKAGLQKAVEYKIDDQSTVKIFSAPYFLASKLEAFNNRGGNDGRTSSDFEDIVFIMDNRPSLWNETANADKEVRHYIINEFRKLDANPHFKEWVYAHLYASPLIDPQHIFDGIRSLL